MNKAHVTHPELKATFNLDILGVKKNPNGAMYSSLGVITKGGLMHLLLLQDRCSLGCGLRACDVPVMGSVPRRAQHTAAAPVAVKPWWLDVSMCSCLVDASPACLCLTVLTGCVDRLRAGTIIEVNVSELGLVTPAGKVVWGKYAQVRGGPWGLAEQCGARCGCAAASRRAEVLGWAGSECVR